MISSLTLSLFLFRSFARKALTLFVRLLAFAILTQTVSLTALAWSPSGHHVISVVAYELLNVQDQAEVTELLTHMPEFEKYFAAPDGVRNQGSIDRWRIGVAGNWPDLIRGTDLDRPTWHYELGASRVLGNVKPDRPPGPLPTGATLDTQKLYLSQATELCRRILADRDQSQPDRAVALCWLLHLYADGHQPCHAGSLYAPAFKGGDRGANRIELRDGGNLHRTWDQLLGNQATANEVRRRVADLGDVKRQIMPSIRGVNLNTWLEPGTWIQESKVLAQKHVYTDEILTPVIAASRGLTQGVPKLSLSKSYYQAAGQIARQRAMEAGFRVGVVIHQCLADENGRSRR